MPNTEEQRLDLIENCDYLLEKILSPFEQTDNTPEGRMITQLKWLKERAANHDLPLPVNPDYLATLRYIYTDGELCRHASSPDNRWEEIEAPMKKIISISKKGKLIYKPEYQVYAVRCVNVLVSILEKSERALNQYESELIDELHTIKRGLSERTISPPLGSPLPRYPAFRKVFRINRSSIDDLPHGKEMIKLIDDLVFNGVRPDTWLTPELADQETRQYL